MKKKIIEVIIILVLLSFFFPKPCGRYTTAAVPMFERKCYGIKIPSLFSVGGGLVYCIGVCSSVLEPSFYCNSSGDCISGCGWRAYNGGCIAVNKNSKDYLMHNRLHIEERFPIVCYKNSCGFRIDDEIIGFSGEDNKILPQIMFSPESSLQEGRFYIRSHLEELLRKNNSF